MKTNQGTVMIVDDDSDIRELMKMVIESEGYHVDVASDGLDALRQLQSGARPELILLDLMMPGMDGEQFLKEIGLNHCRNTPIVIVSGHAGAQQKADELRAACCLMKPIECDELLKAIRKFAAPVNEDMRL